ncbi:hypothetical protein CDEST_13877 [Colletotrichum destructivum]|uniref:Uncharacterized protein n=1 Tax=Colletotrichum destructivum TaxID=34406 RepID=A0AAX4J0G4_9PEZI|nr:hypothetical protein CDEST_13877 [Colletotrichum destructivum]
MGENENENKRRRMRRRHTHVPALRMPAYTRGDPGEQKDVRPSSACVRVFTTGKNPPLRQMRC